MVFAGVTPAIADDAQPEGDAIVAAIEHVAPAHEQAPPVVDAAPPADEQAPPVEEQVPPPPAEEPGSTATSGSDVVPQEPVTQAAARGAAPSTEPQQSFRKDDDRRDDDKDDDGKDDDGKDDDGKDDDDKDDDKGDPDSPKVKISKSNAVVAQNAELQWVLSYEVTVTNRSSKKSVSYALTDTPQFDRAFDVVGSGSWTAQGSSTPVVDASGTLSPGASTIWTYHVIAVRDTDEAVTHRTLTCTEDGKKPGGGFYNVATVTFPGGSARDAGCGVPATPTIEKTAEAAYFVDGAWRLSYTVTVRNDSAVTLGYVLTDTPDVPPAGVSYVGDWVASGPVRTPADAGTGVLNPAWNGGSDTTVATGSMPAGASHSYVVTGSAHVAPEADVDALTCPGDGLTNTASVSNGIRSSQSTACAPLVVPTFTKDALDLTPVEGSPGQFDVRYLLTVQGGASAGSYDLVDNPGFASGIDIVSGTAQQLTPVVGDPIEDIAAGVPFAEGIAIAANTEHTWQVTWRVERDVEVTGISEGCEQEGPGHGLFNAATLTFAGIPREASDCLPFTPPTVPTVDKTAEPTTRNDDGTQRVSYLITVTAPDPVVGQPVTDLDYTLTDHPADLGAEVKLVGSWRAEAVDPATLPISEASWDGVGDWVIAADGQFTAEEREAGDASHTYLVWADVDVKAVAEPDPATCPDSETGIPVWNDVTVVSGTSSNSDRACATVEGDGVTIEKTSELPGDATSVQPGDQFTYVLTIANTGMRAATDVRVTDSDISERLQILGLEVTGGVSWGPAPGYGDGAVDLTIASLDAGQSVEVRILVEFLAPEAEQGALVGDGEVPAVTPPLDSLTNTACVSSAEDTTPDCDTHEIDARDISVFVYTRCVADASLLGWTVTKSESLINEPIDFLWVPNNLAPTTEPQQVALSAPGGQLTWSEEIAWPGAFFSPSGVSVDWPGWRALEATDFAPGGGYYLPGTTIAMTPAEEAMYIFNGRIMDPNELDFAWREASTVTISVNPSTSIEVSYPPATPDCSVARESEVQIEKSASVQRAMPGDTFTYTMEVANVNQNGAADGVILTDVIPASIKVNDVTWPGKGNASLVPNWSSCTVTGQNAQGYGGTLTCELFGPLQAAALDGHTAPTVTVSATVNPQAPAGAITNVGVVDYYTFGNPEDTGRDADDAVIVVSLLPATGGALPTVLLWGGLAALLLGAGAVLVVARRRREDSANN